DGLAPQMAELEFALSEWDRDGAALLAPARLRVTLDAEGALPEGFQLWCNSAGARATLYRVKLRWCEQDPLGPSPREVDLGVISLSGQDPVALSQLLALPAPVPSVPGALAQALAAQAGCQTALAGALQAQEAADAAMHAAQ